MLSRAFRPRAWLIPAGAFCTTVCLRPIKPQTLGHPRLRSGKKERETPWVSRTICSGCRPAACLIALNPSVLNRENSGDEPSRPIGWAETHTHRGPGGVRTSDPHKHRQLCTFWASDLTSGTSAKRQAEGGGAGIPGKGQLCRNFVLTPTPVHVRRPHVFDPTCPDPQRPQVLSRA